MADVAHRTPEIQRFDAPRGVQIAALAERQHGAVSFGQLRKLGMGAGAIDHAVRIGRLHRLHRGVYAVGRRSVTREGEWIAAVLACGEGAVLSHLSAAALWGLLRDSRKDVDVTVPRRTRRGSGDIVPHTARRWHEDDQDERSGIPVTSLARTLFDLGEVVSPRRHARAIDEAERLGLFDLRAVEEVCERSVGRRGLRPMRTAIARYRPLPPLTRSELERRFVEMCDGAGLPRPAMNLFVAGHEVDASWLDRRLVVEIDGFEFHRGRSAFEADRRRDAALQREGLRVLRVTHRRLQDDRAGIVADLRALLDVT